MFAMRTCKEIDALQLRSMLQGMERDIALIDVRTAAEVAQCAIPGARHIPLALLQFSMEQLTEDKPLVFYCRSGSRSAQACALVTGLGRRNVFKLRGGIIRWGPNAAPNAPPLQRPS